MSKEKFETVPLQGSLGLLASGAKGLRAWREAKKNAQQKLEKHSSKND